MGRRIVISGFLLCLATALYLFLTRDSRPLSENIDGIAEKDPRVILEDFVVYRYQDNTLKAKLTARLGHFFEPNLLELDGEIRAMRVTADGIERLSAESATAFFYSESMNAMMQGTELDRAELTGFVEVGVREHVLTTDFAEYVARTDVVSSNRPVRVEGPGRVFSGEEGFRYGVSDQTLVLDGPIRGEVKSDED